MENFTFPVSGRIPDGRTESMAVDHQGPQQIRQFTRSPSWTMPKRRSSWHGSTPEKHAHHSPIMHHLNSQEWRDQFRQQCMERVRQKREHFINTSEVCVSLWKRMKAIIRNIIEAQLKNWISQQPSTAQSTSMMDISKSYDNDVFLQNMERDIYQHMWNEYREPQKDS
ncbi:hypothetical protein BDF19DRAFT_418965 [Syncephalis fuscata]|nr:hypothetical protein BDF19DRAFT_418965 [Syncephalis fuscata]